MARYDFLKRCQSQIWVIDKIAIGVTYDSEPRKGEEADQTDRAGAAAGPGIRAADHRASEDAGGRPARRLRREDPGEDDDGAGHSSSSAARPMS
jgi:hypothetical protein